MAHKNLEKDTQKRSILGKINFSPIIIFLFLLAIFFGIASPYFISIDNFNNIIVQSSTIGILALGITFVMINGNIDLSIGSTLGLCSAIFVRVYNSSSLSVAIVVTLLAGIVVGLFNGLCVWKLRLDSFIVTLAGMIGIKGLLFAVTKENSITLDDFSFTELGTASFLGFPILGYIYILLSLILWFVQQKTLHGRNIYLVGGNRNGARDVGISTGIHQVYNFVICSTFAAIAAILLCSQLGAATPNTGKGYELWAITAAALGGIKLTGGVGYVLTVLIGGITIGTLRNGMNLMSVSTAYIYVVMGLVLLSVMILDKYLGVIKSFRNYLKNK